MGQNEPHFYTVMRLTFWLAGVFGAEYIRSQGQILLSQTSEPEPDLAVTTRHQADYLRIGTPPVLDLRLLIEVSDAAIGRDLGFKADLYSRAGVPEYWVVDLNARRFLAHRQPTENGYQGIIAYAEDESIAPLAAPERTVMVAEMLPPPPQ